MSIKDITPKEFKCIVGACPGIFETDRNTYILIGVELKKDQLRHLGLQGRVGNDETVIEIPKDILNKAQIKHS